MAFYIHLFDVFLTRWSSRLSRQKVEWEFVTGAGIRSGKVRLLPQRRTVMNPERPLAEGSLTPDQQHEKSPPQSGYTGCGICRHWSPPSQTSIDDYTAFLHGSTKRPARTPVGTCDRIILISGGALCFGATKASFSCLNYEGVKDLNT